MTPDISSPQRAGIAAMAAAVLAAAGMCWYMWSDQPVVDERLEAARAAAAKITGKEPLRARVDLQRGANAQLRTNLAELKTQSGFTASESFRVPPGEREPGNFYLKRFVNARQGLRDKANARRIDFDERLGFPADDRAPPDADAQPLLDMLELTEKALGVVLDAPDPVEWFKISHGKPELTGPANRPPLLREYPLTLEVRGSLKTILWILHRYGQRAEGDYPLILRGLKIESDNTKSKDDVQQLEATFQLAAMTFVSDEERGVKAAAKPTSGGGAAGSTGGGRGARP